MPTPEMSDITTRGVRIGATAFYLPGESSPTDQRYTFGYRIVILNEGPEPVRLLSRHWIIIDGDGHRRDVHGEGVVGQTPRLEPGQAFKYASFTVLPTEWGTMEGAYQLQTDGGEAIEATIGRFWLTMDKEA